MTDTAPDVRGLEERAFNAWPALDTLVAGGWLLRFAEGYTKRANSLNALAPTVAVGEAVAHATPLYAAAGLPLVVRVTPLAGPDADRALSDRGFAHLDPSLVLTAPLPSRRPCDPRVAVAALPSAAWRAGYAGAAGTPSGRQTIHARMLARIRLPAAFAELSVDGAAIAWGLAVAERGQVGLFDIVTAPAARRQGAGRALVDSLLGWGADHGCTGAYLQVAADNREALPLYEQLGFRGAYRYHYRVAPAST
jgi:ribosomal protein S18 acetylase RimI-like enzyme